MPSEAEFAALREQVVALREDRATHAEKIVAVSTRVDTIATDVKEILGYMQRAKGSWKTLATLGGVIAAVVEGIHQLVTFLHK
jgi:hypothetical protein